MPRENQDAIFTFNGEEMKKFFKSLGEGVNNIGSSMQNMTKNIASGVKKGMGHFAKLGIVFLGLKKLVGQIPEIGQAFSIAKDVALRNFLWPLRKWLMPLLQKMLDWVRDHRAQFVKWGQHLVNIIKGVISVVKTVFNTVKNIIGSITGTISKVFSGMAGGADQAFNIIVFKINAILMFIGEIIKEIGGVIGDIWKGLEPHIKPIWEIIKLIVDEIGKMIKALGLAEISWEDFGSAVGSILTTVVGLVGMVVSSISTIVQGISQLGEGFAILGDILSGKKVSGERARAFLEKPAQLIDEWGKSMEKYANLIGGSWKETFKPKPGEKAPGTPLAPMIPGPNRDIYVKDAIVTPRGDVIHTDPSDYIIATKTPSVSIPNVNVTVGEPRMPVINNIMPIGKPGDGTEKNIRQDIHISFGPFTVTVTEGDAVNAGRKFAEGISETLRDSVLGDLVREGA